MAGRLAIALLLCLLTPWALADEPSAKNPTTLKIHFQVAIESGLEDANTKWLREHIQCANHLLADSGIVLEPSFSQLEGETVRHLRTRADRHALGKNLSGEPIIHAFVVQTLKDVDIEDKWISGVHWRPRGLPGKHFIILSRKAQPWTLAHELGHFFGNKHSDTVNNIMSYEHDGSQEPFFDSAQRKRIARRLQHFLGTLELAPTPQPK